MAQVEVVYAKSADEAWHTTHELTPNMTVQGALDASGIFERHPEAKNLPVGIFSRVVTYETKLTAGDRVELYRALPTNPKEKRRARAGVRA